MVQEVEAKYWIDVSTVSSGEAIIKALEQTKKAFPEAVFNDVEVGKIVSKEGGYQVQIIYYIEIPDNARNIKITQVKGI